MPDRSKKRKKNKNKRKPKPHLNETPHNTDTVSETSSEISFSNDTGNFQNSAIVIDDKKDEIRSNDDVKINFNEDSYKPGYELTDDYESNKQDPEYFVESPDKSLIKIKSSLTDSKSKSLDECGLSIVEVVELSSEVETQPDSFLSTIDCNNVCESESDIEWEIADELDGQNPCNDKAVILSVSQPLTVAQCEHTQPLTPAEELSLRQYLGTLDLVTCPQDIPLIVVESEAMLRQENITKIKLRKKKFNDDTSRLKNILNTPLEVIAEEGSGDSAISTRRHSYLVDKKSDLDDLEDDVFLPKSCLREDTEKFPVPIPPPRKKYRNRNNQPLTEQECKLVDTKIIETKPSEGCGSWTVETLDKVKGAEVVYLTDSSSCTSTSDIYDIAEDVETEDSDIRVDTPTIDFNNANSLLINPNVATIPLISFENSDPNDSPPLDITTDKDDSANEFDSKCINENEIVVLSTENISTSLYVKDIDPTSISDNTNNSYNCKDRLITLPDHENEHKDSSEEMFQLKEPKTPVDTEINDLKRELNSVFNNLMKEVATESETVVNPKECFARQDSSSSVSSSQCTAKYNPDYASLNDIDSLVHDEPTNTSNISEPFKQSHVKDVYEYVAGTGVNKKQFEKLKEPSPLKVICLNKIASFPFGTEILEELALVSEKLQNANLNSVTPKKLITNLNMPYFPLPDISTIRKVALPKKLTIQELRSPPPPRRNSSLRVCTDEKAWVGVPTKKDPSLYVCLSPSQKMLMEKTNTVIDEEDAGRLIETHKNFINRRGYNEKFKNEIDQQTKSKDAAVPFRNQARNRLLAIIRDPSINDIASKLKKSHKPLYSSQNEIHDGYQRNLYNHSNLSAFRSEENISNLQDRKFYPLKIKETFYGFKPVPPPRPLKFSTTCYESDESSDFTDNSYRSIKSEKKYFHYSTGNLNKDIENDISVIQDMHRKYRDIRDSFESRSCTTLNQPPRRPSLPKELCEQQMSYILQKEKQIEEEILRLQSEKFTVSKRERCGPRAPLIKEDLTKNGSRDQLFNLNSYQISKKRDVALHSTNSSVQSKKDEKPTLQFKSSQEELLREKMYSEYISKIAEREQRKQHKIIKITNSHKNEPNSISLPEIKAKNELKVNNIVEEEFISKAKERWEKLGIQDPETDDEYKKRNIYNEPDLKIVEQNIKVIEKGEIKDMDRLPNHLKEFVKFTAGEGEEGKTGEWKIVVPVLCAFAVVMLVAGKQIIAILRNN